MALCLHFSSGCYYVTLRALLQARSQAECFCAFEDTPSPRLAGKEQGLELDFLEHRLECWHQRTRVTSNLPVWLTILSALFLSYLRLNNIIGRLSMKVHQNGHLLESGMRVASSWEEGEMGIIVQCIQSFHFGR